MKIPITTNKPNIQKYIPIPHSVWSQVREILDQHVERGIIRDGDEPSAFCSSNFSGQEKRWQKYQTSIRWLIAKKLYSKEQRSGRAFSILPLSLNISFKSALHVTFLEQSFPFEMASLWYADSVEGYLFLFLGLKLFQFLGRLSQCTRNAIIWVDATSLLSLKKLSRIKKIIFSNQSNVCIMHIFDFTKFCIF